MAHISLSISTEFGSTFEAHLFEDRAICVDLHTNIASGYQVNGELAHQPFGIDNLMIHGNIAALRLLAERIARAVPHDDCASCDCWIELGMVRCASCQAEVAREEAEDRETGDMRCPVRE